MSTTLGAAETNVRVIIRDPAGASDEAFTETEVLRCILDRAIAMAPDLGLGRDWQTGFLSLSDTGSSDFNAVAASNAFARVFKLRNATKGLPIRIIANGEMEELRIGDPVPRGAEPTHATLLEGPGQTLVVRLHPRPTAVRTVDALREVLPTRTYADTTTLPFADDALVALEYESSAALAKQMDATERENRGINLQLIQEWERLAAGSRENSTARLRYQRAKPYGADMMRY